MIILELRAFRAEINYLKSQLKPNNSSKNRTINKNVSEPLKQTLRQYEKFKNE